MVWIGRDLKIHAVQPPCCGQSHLLLDQAAQGPSSLALNISNDGESTASVGNLCEGLTTLSVKNFFLAPNLNLPSYSLKLLPIFLLLHALVKSF